MRYINHFLREFAKKARCRLSFGVLFAGSLLFKPTKKSFKHEYYNSSCTSWRMQNRGLHAESANCMQRRIMFFNTAGSWRKKSKASIKIPYSIRTHRLTLYSAGEPLSVSNVQVQQLDPVAEEEGDQKPDVTERNSSSLTSYFLFLSS